jgi:hypothetical protein
MGNELLKGLKIVLLIHFVLGIIIGIVFLFIPEIWCTFLRVTMTDHGVLRLIGAASLALGFSSFLAYRSKDWGTTKLFVQMEFVWLLSAIVGMLWWLIESGPIAGWWVFGMFVCFLAAFIVFYIQQEK